MKVSPVECMRNVAVVSHAGSGKTSLVEGLVYAAGGITHLGSVLNGTTVSDFEPEEIHRRTSLNTSVLHFTYKDIGINLVDTPGASSFFGETLAALRAVDGVVLVINAASGMRSELVRLWSIVREFQLPCVVFVNELDKEGTSLTSTLDAMQAELEMTGIPLLLPNGTGGELSGVIDVISQRTFSADAEHPRAQEGQIPSALLPAAEQAKKGLIEAVAEIDDGLLEKYVSEGDLSTDELGTGLRSGVHRRRIIPVLCGSAVRNIGTHALLDAIVGLLPSPLELAAIVPLQGHSDQRSDDIVTRRPSPTDPFSGFVFKTIIDPFMGRLSYVRVASGTLSADTAFYNASRQVKEKGGHLFTIFGRKYVSIPSATAGDIIAIGKLKDTMTGDSVCDERVPIQYAALHLARPVLSFAVEAKSKADIEKVSLGLHKLIEEDPALEFVRNPETKEMVLSGMGQLHLDVALEKLHRKYGADVTVHTPRVPYRETIRTSTQAQGKYKKQTGGHGQYGDCWLELTPLPRGAGFKFENKVVGGAIPRNFIPAIEKGVVEAMHEGVLAGYPVVDIRATVFDGSYHVVDSSELAFKIAASMAFKKSMEHAHPVLLEPIMAVDIEAPEDAIGAVIGDLNSRRGRIVTVTATGHTETIKATIPLAEVLKYAPSLTSITGGRGTYVMEFSHYEEVPRELTPRIVEEHRAGRQAVATH